ncbi:hypothetical protein X882_5711 [Burkholderia pseudomallei MSHR4303]|nr:hypothetical protein X882_5711 [Burkholderia pseudomallei MSHR4303]
MASINFGMIRSVMHECVAGVMHIGGQIVAFEDVRVQMLAVPNRFSHVVDHHAVTQNLVIRRQLKTCDLVTELDGLRECDVLALDLAPLCGNEAVILDIKKKQSPIGMPRTLQDDSPYLLHVATLRPYQVVCAFRLNTSVIGCHKPGASESAKALWNFAINRFHSTTRAGGENVSPSRAKSKSSSVSRSIISRLPRRQIVMS